MVYETFEEVVNSRPELAALRGTGLERSEALRRDLEWLRVEKGVDPTPPCGQVGLEYRALLLRLAEESLPRFLCHFYNHYFAHTAGGRAIGKRMADALLEGRTLAFYQWEGDVKELLEGARRSIDRLAEDWSAEERQACLEETAASFQYGTALVGYMKPSE